jgi:hypothetical protein
MIMKKPIIIAHSAFQGFSGFCARLSHARQVAPDADGVAVLNSSPHSNSGGLACAPELSLAAQPARRRTAIIGQVVSPAVIPGTPAPAGALLSKPATSVMQPSQVNLDIYEWT